MLIRVDKKEIRVWGGTITGKTVMELLNAEDKKEYCLNNEKITKEEFLKSKMNIAMAGENFMDGDNIPLLAMVMLAVIDNLKLKLK